MKVLNLENNDRCRKENEITLANLPGVEVTSTKTVEESLIHIDHDLFVVDLFLGYGAASGLDFIRKLRERNNRKPIIIQSGHIYQELLVATQGMDLIFMDKSVSRSILFRTAKALLEKKELPPFYVRQSKDLTNEYLFPYGYGNKIGFYEAAGILLNRDGEKNIACISSQTKCKHRCKFCGSWDESNEGARNLSIAEMQSEIKVVKIVSGFDDTLVAIMGIGQPLDNYKNLAALMTDKSNMYSISTLPLIASLKRFAEDEEMMSNKKIELFQISISDPYNDLDIMPAIKDQNLRQVKFWGEKIKKRSQIKRLCLSYTPWLEINDDPKHALRIADLAEGWAEVRINRGNDVGRGYKPTTTERELKLAEVFQVHHIPFKVFTSSGREDTAVGCGMMGGKIKQMSDLMEA